MKTNLTAMALVVVVSGCAFGDSGSDDLNEVGMVSQAVQLSSARTVPYPIVTKWEDGSVQTQYDPLTNKPRLAWDAGYMEMLIADEYAKCVVEVAGESLPAGSDFAYPSIEQDSPAMHRIASAVSKSPCARNEYLPLPNAFPQAPVEWAVRRSDPHCNIDPTTGEPLAAITLPKPDDSSMVRDFAQKVEDAKTDPATPLGGFVCVPNSNLKCTKADAFEYLYQADVGQCFAERLSELLEGAEIFSADTQQHMLTLGLAHERAQDAMMKLGHLLKLQRKDPSDLPMNNNNGDGTSTGAVLRLWIESSPAQIDRIRTKFLRATRLVAATSTSLANYLERQAGARWTTAAGGGAFSRDWGIGSARNRLLNLVYGGGSLDDLWGVENYAGDDIPWFSEIRTPSSDPQVSVLFNLARDADALFIRPQFSGNGDVTLLPQSWETLYLETELGLLAKYCQKPTAAECTKDALRPSLPTLSNASAFMLYRYYGLNLEHASRLSNALLDAAVRHDMADRPRDPEIDDPLETTHGTFHLSGVHTNSAPAAYSGQAGWIHLDKGTQLLPYGYEDRAQDGRSVCSPASPSWFYFAQCPFYKMPGWTPERHGILGVVPALAFAREVLFEQAGGTTDPEVSESLASAVAQVERLIGTTTVIRRPDSVVAILRDPIEDPTLINPPGDLAGVRVAAKDRTYQGPNGVTRKLLDDQVPMPGDPALGNGEAAGLKRFVWTPPGATWQNKSSLLLRNRTTPSDYLFITQMQGLDQPSSTAIEGGWFADQVSKVTAVSDADWSRSKYDGFGLLANWVPPADASIMGGSAGEESYQYLLRSAKAAAEEATSAVKTAIDRLSEEARDESALSQAETKAQTLGDMEEQSLCGKTDACKLEMKTVSFYAEGDPCSVVPLTSGQSQCRQALTRYMAAMPQISIPAVVADPITDWAIQFGSAFNGAPFAGSELQKTLVRIWNAARLLTDAKDQAVKLSIALGQEGAASYEALNAALALDAAAQSELNSVIQSSQNVNLSDIMTADAKVGAADDEVALQSVLVSKYCEPFSAHCNERCIAWDDDDCSIWAVGCDEGTNAPNVPEIAEYCIRNECGLMMDDQATGKAQAEQCRTVATRYKDATILREEASRERSAIIAKKDWLNESLTAAIAAARAKRDSQSAQLKAARLEHGARASQVEVQVGSHISVIQQTTGELYAALAEFRQLRLKADQNRTRTILERDLARSTASTNTNLRRRFRSYDLWRARALLESARRLANAARRSIEARFVVNLSQLDAEQAFVAAPSQWADEIYQSDLNAPEVVGLTLAPKIEGAIYPNKLVDYVGNLERFVQGYAVTYPTSVSLPDTEVVTLGGPDRLEEPGGAALTSLSPDTSGWRFYCAEQRSWISHPGIDEYPTVSRTATACNGKPPSLAKIGFWFDPWGTLNGSWANPKFTDRHNVRWRRLAVNLVGTGIRDCANATDSMSCYTNPYVRFNLVQAGPSWQTNYAGEWRALEIPTANIEGGKALAAEEWLEPVTNSWNMPYVANVARGELFGRPAAGNYELVFEITKDVRLDRIERVQLLVEQDYWVKQNGGSGVYGRPNGNLPSGSGGSSGVGGSSNLGGATGVGGALGTGGATSGGATATGGTTGTGGTTSVTLTGSCTPVGNDARIEDFEDHDKNIGTFEQRLGRWYAFHAGTCTVSPPTSDSFIPVAPSPSNGSNYVGHTDGTGCDVGTWQGGGIGFSFLSNLVNNTETVCPNYDATKYTGISFDAQGSGEIRVEICMSDIPNDGDCHGAYIGINSAWTTYTVRWSNLTQVGWGAPVTFNRARLRKMQFKGRASTFNFNIDNVKFINN
jgi:hypothetical protein